MKGLTHFVVGLSAGVFFQEAVGMSIDTKSLILLLGGIYGILPDTLDFKLGRFLERFDIEIDLDPEHPDPKQVAEKLASAIDNAARGSPQNVKLHTLKLGPDLWQEYTLFFDREKKEVRVKIGPVVSTSQVPVKIPNFMPSASASFHANLVQTTYDKEDKINIFDGPSYIFKKSGEGVESIFIPWHRKWSHSFTMGALVALVALPFGAIYWTVAFLGFSLHIIVDMLGVMGSNLLFPFTKSRAKGLGLFNSADPIANFGFIYLSVFFIIYNLNRFTYHLSMFRGIGFWLFGFAIPTLGMIIAGFVLRRKKRLREEEAKREEATEVET